MLSHRRLWVLLAALGCPLVFEATLGCQVFFPLNDLDDNALHCACSCNGTGDGQLFVVAGSDDAEQVADTMELAEPDLDLDLGEKLVGIRFAAVGIPRGAIIQSAYVQFYSSGNNTAGTDLTISAEASTDAATFTTADDDLSGRTVGAATPVAWHPLAWSGGAHAENQQTPSLVPLLQELVDLPGWSASSAVVLRIGGSGHRTAAAFEDSPGRAPILVVTYDASVQLTLPVCATPGAPTGPGGALTDAVLVDECSRVKKTLDGLAAACGYPAPCDCNVVDVPDQDDSFQSDVCRTPCSENPVDAPECTKFDPVAFTQCVAGGGSVASCESHVTATNASGDSPVCVTAGSPLAFEAFGHRSQCDVSGTSQIHLGDREPKHDPDTDGVVEILGGPCDGGGCPVHPYVDITMKPITFDVKFHSDPTFGNLSATGRGLQTATVDGTGQATFPANAITGTGNGRRGDNGKSVDAMNGSPLVIGVDWAGHTCSLNGNLATDVDGETPDGHCVDDDSIVCTADSPDCDDAGGTCVFPAEDPQSMTVDVVLEGRLANQPPVADAGPDQVVECTSPAGASFTLDGRGSSDPDDDLALFSWHEGSRTGPEVGKAIAVGRMLGVGVAKTYVLRVIDGHAQADEDATVAGVVDTTPPVIACNAPPTIASRNAPISFRATATDVCDPQVPATVTAYDCFAFKNNKRVSKLQSCKVVFKNDTLTIKDGGGIGDHITWLVRAADDSGNAAQVQCEVIVVQ